MSTTTPFRMSSAQLRTAAFTPTGRDRKGGEAARAEIDRRAAKNGQTIAPAKVTPQVAVDLAAQARKVANRLAHTAAEEFAPEGKFVNLKLQVRSDLLSRLADMGAEKFLAAYGN